MATRVWSLVAFLFIRVNSKSAFRLNLPTQIENPSPEGLFPTVWVSWQSVRGPDTLHGLKNIPGFFALNDKTAILHSAYSCTPEKMIIIFRQSTPCTAHAGHHRLTCQPLANYFSKISLPAGIHVTTQGLRPKRSRVYASGGRRKQVFQGENTPITFRLAEETSVNGEYRAITEGNPILRSYQ